MMTDQEAVDLIRHMQHWGYDLADPPHPRSPGYGRLIIALRPKPTENHYDPEAIHLQLSGAQGFPTRTTVTSSTALGAPTKVYPGQVELTDRFNVRRGFFTYGATIDMGSTTNQTVLDIRSPAPILELTGALDESISEQLVSETQALWAKVSVQWGADDSGYWRCLGSVQPEKLYASTIFTLWETYRNSRILRQTFPQFFAMLRRELTWAERLDSAPASVRPLNEVVYPAGRKS
jgi:hypothetical protein